MKAIGKTPVYWIVRIVLSLAIVFIFSACAAPAPLPAEEGTPTPTLTPTATPESTPTSRPTEIVVSKFTSTLVGVSPEFARKLDAEGINESLNDDGTIKSVTVGYNPDGTAIVEKDVKIVASGINFQTDFQGNILKDANGKPISQDIHNLGYVNGIATVVDDKGKAVFWSEAEKAWMRPIELKTDNLESPNAYRFGKTQWLETALLNPELNKSFDQAAIDAWKASPGYSIYFEYDKATDSSHAVLSPRSDLPIRFVFDKNGSPVFFTTKTPDGIVHESILIQLLNPADPSNPKPEETLFVLADPGMWLIPTDQGSGGLNYREFFKNVTLPRAGGWNKMFPYLQLASRNGFFAKVGSLPLPTLDSLFSQPGNDPKKLKIFDTNIETRMNELGPNEIISQTDLISDNYYFPIDPGLQKMLLPLSFARK